MSTWDAVPYILLIVKLLLIVVATIFFISGVDDACVDLLYVARRVFRRLTGRPAATSIAVDGLADRPEQMVAVMVPAWHEADVIYQMLTNAVATLDYRRYHIFVGTYLNDPATQREVLRAAAEHPQVHCVGTGRRGPTCKADCLNAVYTAIRQYEGQQGITFEIFVLQDAEDWPHALSLKLFNLLIPLKDMVQVPVEPLPRRWWDLTAGHYLDEFAENHLKNIVVRQMLRAGIPSAGVGTAFSRRALAAVAAVQDGMVFNTQSLTEDYEIGLLVHALGMDQAFVRASVPRRSVRRRWRRGRLLAATTRDRIAVRAYFPHSFRAAVKQKGRWVLGITLQGYRNIGWTGQRAADYMLFRDRKGLFTSVANVLGYLSLATVLAIWAAGRFLPDGYRFPPLAAPGSLLYFLIAADTGFLALRLLVRAVCTYRLYGVTQAMLAIPRQVWGNFINFGAVCRAIRLYVTAAVTGGAIAWGKTEHVFPTDRQLRVFRRALGDALAERQLGAPCE